VFSFDLNGTPTLEDDFSGNTIPGTVEHLLFGEISYTHPSGWYGAFDVLYVGEQFANNANSVKVDSYTVANLRLGLERAVGSTIISPFIGINNLFDEGYNNNIRLNAFGSRYFEPAPELNVYAGVSINFDLQ
jgi:iron complex outermembrane receptor protein